MTEPSQAVKVGDAPQNEEPPEHVTEASQQVEEASEKVQEARQLEESTEHPTGTPQQEEATEKAIEAPQPQEEVPETVTEAPQQEESTEKVIEAPQRTEEAPETVVETLQQNEESSQKVAEAPQPMEDAPEKVVETSQEREESTQKAIETPQPTEGAPETVTEAPQQNEKSSEKVVEAPQPTEDGSEKVVEAPQETVTEAPQQNEKSSEKVVEAPQETVTETQQKEISPERQPETAAVHDLTHEKPPTDTEPTPTPKPEDGEKPPLVQKDQGRRTINDVLNPTTVHTSTGPTQAIVKRTVVTKPQSEVQTRRFVQQHAQVQKTPPSQHVQPMQPVQTMQTIQHSPQTMPLGQYHAIQALQQPTTIRQGQKVVTQRAPAAYCNRTMVPQAIYRSPRPAAAAPFPELPSAHEIQALIKAVDAELEIAKKELQQLQYWQRRGIITVPKMSERDPSLHVQDYKGYLISHPMVEDVESVSRQRGDRARAKWRLGNVSHKYTHLSHIPHMQTVVHSQEDLIEPMYLVVRNWKSVVAEKAYSLAIEYVERRAKWVNLCAALNEESKQARRLLDQWPPEFTQCQQKTNDALIKSLVGPDEPMYLDPLEGQSYGFFDMNKFVEDPVAEHNAYRKRLVWTEAEVKTFLERYAQHPREFKRISTGLPMKTVKDVIEFYNIHRIDLNLKDIEVASRKRGRKKMISEGVVRK